MSTKPACLPTNLTQTTTRAFAIPSEWKTAACVLAADAFALFLAFGLTVSSRRLFGPTPSISASAEILPCLAMALIAFWSQGLYPGILRHPAEEMRRVCTSISVVFLGTASTTFFWRTAESYSRSMLLAAWVAAPPLVLLARYVLRRLLADKPWWGVAAVVLGSGPVGQNVLRSLQDGMLGVKVTGVLPSEQMLAWSFNSSYAIADSWSHFLGPQSQGAQYAIVAMPERLAMELRHAIQHYCKGFSHIIFVPNMPAMSSLGLSALDIGGALGVEMPQRLFHGGAASVKRLTDITLGSLALLLASPLLLAIMLAIKLTSEGPIFYRQVRVGRNGEKIKALKFRTMVVNADDILEDYLAENYAAEMEWQRDHKLKIDPRVNIVGQWLRRFSLDELPQLWNVIGGQMSLVGPRPIVESEIEKYGRGYELYTRVRPGITGLWQVSGRNNTTYEERVSFDEYYVRNWSGWLDAYLLVCTIKAVLTADGAY
jgi:Undecaprenyl-phosphate galactose phosphotransferase WbaP